MASVSPLRMYVPPRVLERPQSTPSKVPRVPQPRAYVLTPDPAHRLENPEWRQAVSSGASPELTNGDLDSGDRDWCVAAEALYNNAQLPCQSFGQRSQDNAVMPARYQTASPCGRCRFDRPSGHRDSPTERIIEAVLDDQRARGRSRITKSSEQNAVVFGSCASSRSSSSESSCAESLSPERVAGAMRMYKKVATRSVVEASRNPPDETVLIGECRFNTSRVTQAALRMPLCRNILRNLHESTATSMKTVSETISGILQEYTAQESGGMDVEESEQVLVCTSDDARKQELHDLKQMVRAFEIATQAVARPEPRQDLDVDAVEKTLLSVKQKGDDLAKRMDDSWLVYLGGQVFNISLEEIRKVVQKTNGKLDINNIVTNQAKEVRLHARCEQLSGLMQSLRDALEARQTAKSNSRKHECRLRERIEEHVREAYRTQTLRALTQRNDRKFEIRSTTIKLLKKRNNLREMLEQHLRPMDFAVSTWGARITEELNSVLVSRLASEKAKIQELVDKKKAWGVLHEKLKAAHAALSDSHPAPSVATELRVELDFDAGTITSCPSTSDIVFAALAHAGSRNKLRPQTGSGVIRKLLERDPDDKSLWARWCPHVLKADEFNYPLRQKEFMAAHSKNEYHQPLDMERGIPPGSNVDKYLIGFGNIASVGQQSENVSSFGKLLQRVAPVTQVLSATITDKIGPSANPGAEATLTVLLGILAALANLVLGCRVFALETHCRALRLQSEALRAVLGRRNRDGSGLQNPIAAKNAWIHITVGTQFIREQVENLFIPVKTFLKRHAVECEELSRIVYHLWTPESGGSVHKSLDLKAARELPSMVYAEEDFALLGGQSLHGTALPRYIWHALWHIYTAVRLQKKIKIWHIESMKSMHVDRRGGMLYGLMRKLTQWNLDILRDVVSQAKEGPVTSLEGEDFSSLVARITMESRVVQADALLCPVENDRSDAVDEENSHSNDPNKREPFLLFPGPLGSVNNSESSLHKNLFGPNQTQGSSESLLSEPMRAVEQPPLILSKKRPISSGGANESPKTIADVETPFAKKVQTPFAKKCGKIRSAISRRPGSVMPADRFGSMQEERVYSNFLGGRPKQEKDKPAGLVAQPAQLPNPSCKRSKNPRTNPFAESALNPMTTTKSATDEDEPVTKTKWRKRWAIKWASSSKRAEIETMYATPIVAVGNDPKKNRNKKSLPEIDTMDDTGNDPKNNRNKKSLATCTQGQCHMNVKKNREPIVSFDGRIMGNSSVLESGKRMTSAGKSKPQKRHFETASTVEVMLCEDLCPGGPVFPKGPFPEGWEQLCKTKPKADPHEVFWTLRKVYASAACSDLKYREQCFLQDVRPMPEISTALNGGEKERSIVMIVRDKELDVSEDTFGLSVARAHMIQLDGEPTQWKHARGTTFQNNRFKVLAEVTEIGQLGGCGQPITQAIPNLHDATARMSPQPGKRTRAEVLAEMKIDQLGDGGQPRQHNGFDNVPALASRAASPIDVPQSGVRIAYDHLRTSASPEPVEELFQENLKVVGHKCVDGFHRTLIAEETTLSDRHFYSAMADAASFGDDLPGIKSDVIATLEIAVHAPSRADQKHVPSREERSLPIRLPSKGLVSPNRSASPPRENSASSDAVDADAELGFPSEDVSRDAWEDPTANVKYQNTGFLGDVSPRRLHKLLKRPLEALRPRSACARPSTLTIDGEGNRRRRLTVVTDASDIDQVLFAPDLPSATSSFVETVGNQNVEMLQPSTDHHFPLDLPEASSPLRRVVETLEPQSWKVPRPRTAQVVRADGGFVLPNLHALPKPLPKLVGDTRAVAQADTKLTWSKWESKLALHGRPMSAGRSRANFDLQYDWDASDTTTRPWLDDTMQMQLLYVSAKVAGDHSRFVGPRGPWRV